MQVIPDPALVVLVGPSGSGKSTWALAHFLPEEIVSSDRLRAMVGSGEHDLDASTPAFDLLDQIVGARLQRKLTTVVDTLGLDDERRLRHRELARHVGLPAVAVLFTDTEEVCRARNRKRLRPVPAAVLTSQFRRFRQLDVEAEAWDLLLKPEPSRVATVVQRPTVEDHRPASGPGFYLQISRFPKDVALGPWLKEMAIEAERVGFGGIAVMDHLMQIPQVGREWEPMPEAYTTLAYLAASTSTLQLGCLVSGIRLRQPALLGKILATLDVLSGGRAFCGLGAGWFDQELNAYGYTPGRSRFVQLEDTIHILRAMWSPGKATHDGIVHSVKDAVSYPRPLHPIPIVVGGNGARTRGLAIRLADGLNLVGHSNAERLLPEVRVAIAAAGRENEVVISMLDTPLIGASRSDVAERVERWRGIRAASTFAATHHASTALDQVALYRRWRAEGCREFFLSPVGLSDPSDLETWGPVLEEMR
jgi:alkanesulfonate monooxygenase SsuD/methylene tetrahydromethanopterin reductase-like flavin-dependent oxidoreductase (luciferase family)/predicted kinase